MTVEPAPRLPPCPEGALGTGVAYLESLVATLARELGMAIRVNLQSRREPQLLELPDQQ